MLCQVIASQCLVVQLKRPTAKLKMWSSWQGPQGTQSCILCRFIRPAAKLAQGNCCFCLCTSLPLLLLLTVACHLSILHISRVLGFGTPYLRCFCLFQTSVSQPAQEFLGWEPQNGEHLAQIQSVSLSLSPTLLLFAIRLALAVLNCARVSHYESATGR